MDGRSKGNNPTGKGGFGDNPQNRNPGGWKKEDTPRAKLEKIMNELTIEDLRNFKSRSEAERKLGDDIVAGMVWAARNAIARGDIEPMRKLLEFVYGKKVEQSVDLDIDSRSGVFVKGFVLPGVENVSTDQDTDESSEE